MQLADSRTTARGRHDELDQRPWQERLQVGGFQAFSTIDWPNALAAVVFLRGCPWRCGYCHNPDLQERHGEAALQWSAVEAQLVRRRGWLEGVVFSGGEPTVDRCLPQAMARTREMGYRLGLHTGGAYPGRFFRLLPMLDWVGFDIKADIAHYDRITTVPGSAQKAMQSAQLLIASGVAHEFRMTYHSGLLDASTVLAAADALRDMGASNFTLQEFRATGLDDAHLPAHEGVDPALLSALRERFARFDFRPAH